MTTPKRFIAIEEHCITPHLDATLPSRWENVRTRLLDIDDGRLAAMDALGVDVQILSHRTPGGQLRDPDQAIDTARRANDELAAAVDRHPTRFRAFATLPIVDPEASARELTRCVEEFGFVGAMIHGRMGGGFLDHPEFDPILRTLATLNVPLYLHPGEPTDAIRHEYYTGLQAPGEVAPGLEDMFSTGIWGWHVEAGTHAIRMILSGVFDRYPHLQVILGHWGELVPYYIDRVDVMGRPFAPHLRHSPGDYFRQNFYVTPSGFETVPPLVLCMSILGADRIMYSVDYPFIFQEPFVSKGRAYIDDAPLSDTDKAKIAHLNAESLFGID